MTANLLVARYGQAALPFTAFVLIPFDLVTRDVLHEHWRGRLLWVRMAMLIGTGSVLTAFLSRKSEQVALASFLAFAASGIVNAAVYHLLDRWARLMKMNVSNLFAAIADSVIFPFVAFTSVSVWLCVAQASAKFVGGVVWSVAFVWALKRLRGREAWR